MAHPYTDALKSRIAIVTGAAHGIGKAIAVRLAEAGCSVVIADKDKTAGGDLAAQIDARGMVAVFISTDVSVSGQVDSMSREANERFGGIDFLVNNAGICIPDATEKISDAEWESVISTNLSGAFYCARAVLPIMVARRYGRIVNISSLAGRSVSALCGAHYTASKAGLIGLTRHLAREYAPFGIRVNAICPGPIDTRVQHQMLTESQIAEKTNQIPLRRFGQPDDVAHATMFLLSDSSTFITGATMDINGGMLMV